MLDIFKYGDTFLDNNQVERLNRYISISRRNSLFFGSHKGAERGAILYTILMKFLSTNFLYLHTKSGKVEELDVEIAILFKSNNNVFISDRIMAAELGRLLIDSF